MIGIFEVRSVLSSRIWEQPTPATDAAQRASCDAMLLASFESGFVCRSEVNGGGVPISCCGWYRHQRLERRTVEESVWFRLVRAGSRPVLEKVVPEIG
jgi:hypothetical protein